MNYATIKKTDVANGPGIRVSLFVSGCTHHCKGCFNSEAWDFGYGQPYTAETEEEILQALAPDYIRGLSLLGGEPMEPANRGAVLSLVQKVRQRYPGKDIWCYTGYDYERDLLRWMALESAENSRGRDSALPDQAKRESICTVKSEKSGRACHEDNRAKLQGSENGEKGCAEEAATGQVGQLLSLIDVLVDGEFMEERKNLRLAFRGSENQRLVDVKESLRQGRVVCLPDIS